MKIKTLLLTVLTTLIQPVIAEEDLYDLGHKLATCSGAFSQMSNISTILKQDADAKLQSQLSNGYKVAAVVMFTTDKMKNKIAWSSANGIHDTAVTRWEALLGTNNKSKFITNFNNDDNKEFSSNFNELIDNIKICTLYDELVELSVKIMRKSL
jgi:hypothetical protein